MKLKRILNDELDKIVPKMSESVKNAEFPSVVTEEQPRQKSVFKTFTFKAVTAFALVVALFCSIILPLALNKDDGYVYNENSVVILKVNPEIKLVTNANDEIVALSSVNSDADVILIEDGLVDSVKGLKIEDGVNKLIEKCVEYGFISSDNSSNAITVTVSNENLEKGTDLAEKLKTDVNNFITNKNLQTLLTVSSDSFENVAKKLGITYLTATDFISDVTNAFVLQAEKNSAASNDDFSKKYTVDFKNFANQIAKSYYEIMLAKQKDVKALQTIIDDLDDKRYNYWIYKDLISHITDESIKTQIRLADKLIADFSVKYGVEVTILTFNALTTLYVDLDVVKVYGDIFELIESVSDDTELSLFTTAVLAVFADDEISSQIKSVFENLVSRPTDVNEYKAKTTEMVKQRSKLLKQKTAIYNLK